MEQVRKRLVELLLEADYISSKYPWWEKDVTVGAIKSNYEYYKYVYSLSQIYDGKNELSIDYDSIWSVFLDDMSHLQMQDFVRSTLGERYNFGDIVVHALNFSDSDKLV